MTEIIMEAVAETYNVTIGQIRSASRRQTLPEARRMIAHIMRNNGHKGLEIASSITRSRTYVQKAVDKMIDEIVLYADVNNKYLKSLKLMEEKLLKQKAILEKWLTDNPKAEWQLRYDKIKELADVNKQLENYN